MITIRVAVDASNLEAYRRDLDRLVRDLRRLERESPFKFDIIGYRRSSPSISMIRQPSRATIAAALREAHRDVFPRLYSPSIARGGPFPSRVEAAARQLGSMRQQVKWTVGPIEIPIEVTPITEAPVSERKLPSGLTVLVPTESDQCWDVYPLCTAQLNDAVALRGPSLQNGFVP